MKIIELGNIDVQFICPKCHTIFEELVLKIGVLVALYVEN